MTRVGNQNLKFCIELFQENNRKNKYSELNRDNQSFFIKNKDTSKIALLNNELNDIQNNMKESVKNMISNVNEMQDLDDKSAKIKDTSYQFQKDSAILEQQIIYRKVCRKVLIYCIFILIFIIIFYFILY